jgi:hypothetical protein
VQQHDPEHGDDEDAGDPTCDLARGDLGHAAIVAAIAAGVCLAL